MIPDTVHGVGLKQPHLSMVAELESAAFGVPL